MNGRGGKNPAKSVSSVSYTKN